MKRLLPVLLMCVMLLTVCALATLQPAAAAADDPTALYVSDGLTVLLDAYNSKNGTVDVAAQTWRSRVGNTAVTLTGSWTADGRGISYQASAVGGSTGIDMGMALLPAGDFTVEMVLMPHGLTNADGSKVTFDSTYGPSYSYGFAFGAFKGYVYPGLRGEGVANPNNDKRYCSWEVMWYHAAEGYNFQWLADDYSLHDSMDRVMSYSVAADVDANAVYTVRANGTQVTTITKPAVPHAETDGMFRLLYSFPSTVYAVRVYDRLLTQEERAQNHFADLLTYLGLDVAEKVKGMAPDRQKAIFEEFAQADFAEEGLADRILAKVNRLTPSDLLISTPQTDAERAQNHFAEIALEAKLDIAALQDMDEAARAEVYAAFAQVEKGQYDAATVTMLFDMALGNTEAVEDALLNYSLLALRHDDMDGIRYLFTVNPTALSMLEAQYENVRIGALVGLGTPGYYEDYRDLRLERQDGKLCAPANAQALTVYDTHGEDVNGCFVEKDSHDFALTVRINDAAYYNTAVTVVGYAVLTDKEGNSRQLYCYGVSPRYGENPSYERMAAADYAAQEGNAQAMEVYTDCLQAQLKQYYNGLADCPVLVCGVDDAATLMGGKAVWVQYLPDKDPWPSHSDADRAGIRALYVYYPCDYDPSKLNDTQLAEKGAKRIFGYIGIPAGTEYATAGMVCVHGGAGHAYANYTLEAVKNGFAAIALDTEGCHNITGGQVTYNEAEASYTKDPLGHGGKDSFSTEKDPLEQQWLYWAVGDTVLANSVLRAHEMVDESSVGLTGISWGGLITSTTICYDYRFAFCVPVYISFHMSESTSYSVGSLPSRPFAAALWQDAELLKATTVPTMILSSDRDHFASVNTTQASAGDLQQGYLNIKPNFGHSQGAGASPTEIYRYGWFMLGDGLGFITPDRAPTAADGRSIDLTLEVPHDLTNITVKVYYRTSAIGAYGQNDRPHWESVNLSYDAATGRVTGQVPADAVMYYISFAGYSAQLKDLATPYTGHDAFKGWVYSSTEVVYLTK